MLLQFIKCLNIFWRFQVLPCISKHLRNVWKPFPHEFAHWSLSPATRHLSRPISHISQSNITCNITCGGTWERYNLPCPNQYHHTAALRLSGSGCWPVIFQPPPLLECSCFGGSFSLSRRRRIAVKRGLNAHKIPFIIDLHKILWYCLEIKQVDKIFVHDSLWLNGLATDSTIFV